MAVLPALLLSACFFGTSRPEDEPRAAPLGTTQYPAPMVGAPAAPPSPPSGSAPRTVPPARENHLSPATRSLVAQTHTLAAKGDFDAASSTLDRALRIEPHNPLLWIEMGRLRLAEHDEHQAESCGRKALTLASGDRSAQAQAGRLLADALRAQGRNPEAIEVERRPFMQ